MRLLLDEDSQADVMVRLLRAEGHDVETVNGAGIAGADDLAVFEYARQTERIILTRNADDFKRLHDADRAHFGILIEYQDENPGKNMSYEQVARAVGKIEESGWSLAGEVVSLNAWQ